MAEIMLVVAVGVTAFIGGVCLAAVAVTASLSHLHQRTQRELRHWRERARAMEHPDWY